MKLKTLAIALAGSIIIFVMPCPAQMGTPSYDSYVTVSLDANNVAYQTVVVEGTTTGYVPPQCQYRCGQYNWCILPGCPPTHTPKIYNVFNGLGGWAQGGGAYPNSYISYSTTVSAQAIAGQPISGETMGTVDCSMAGTFFYQ